MSGFTSCLLYFLRQRITSAATVSLLWGSGVTAQGGAGFDDWFTRAIEAPTAFADVPENQAGIELRSEVLKDFPQVARNDRAALTIEELSKLSELLSQLGQDSAPESAVLLDDLLTRYKWDETTLDQLAFMRMMYAPPVTTPAMIPEEELRSTEQYLLAAQKAISQQQWESAEQLCDQLLEAYPKLSPVQRRVAYKLKLLSLVSQNPLPTERVELILPRLEIEQAFRDEALWNLGVRLLLRQVVHAETREQETRVWQAGLARLSQTADHCAMRANTLSDLDQFLKLPSKAPLASQTLDNSTPPLIEPVAVLDSFMAMGLDVTALRELNQRKTVLLSRAGLTDLALDTAWRQVLLNMVPDGDPLAALQDYANLSRSLGRPGIADELIDSSPTKTSGWEAFSGRVFNELAPANRSNESLNQRVIRSILHGPSADGVLAAQQALAAAETMDTWRIFDALSMVAVEGTRDLRQASESLRWHLRRVADQLPPSSENDEFAERLQKTWELATDSVESYQSDAFVSQSDYVQRLVLRNQLQRRSGANTRWAIDALEIGQPGLSALFWGQAILDASLADNPTNPEAEVLENAVEALAAALRGLDDKDFAVEMIGRVNRELNDPYYREPVLFLGVTLLYELGRMEDCLLAMDRVEALNPQWDESKQFSAGLIRAVAQIKLGRLEDAESVLVGLSGLNGENDVMAQVVFLRGWIHLSRNKTQPALERFRSLVETYPGTSYATKTRELLRRLEKTSAANGS